MLDTSVALITPSPLVSAATFNLAEGEAFNLVDISRTAETSVALIA